MGMRIRTVKPEFWQSEDLGNLPREVRMLAVALLNWADDEGFFKSHPRLISGSLLPFDADGERFVSKALPQLVEVGYVRLFEGGIGQVVTFNEHQYISRATKSKLREKATTEIHHELAVSLNPHGGLTEGSHLEGKGREGNREQQNGGAVEEDSQGVGVKNAPLAELWNARAFASLGRVTKITASRKKSTDARLLERPFADFERALDELNASAFCRGEVVPRDGSQPWAANFDWFIKPDSVVKLLEGAYRDRKTPVSKTRPNPDEGILSRAEAMRGKTCLRCGAAAECAAFGVDWCYRCSGAFEDANPTSSDGSDFEGWRGLAQQWCEAERAKRGAA